MRKILDTGKFEFYNLPMLVEGYDFSSWCDLYINAKQSMQETKNITSLFYQSDKKILVNLYEIKDPNILCLGNGNKSAIIRYVLKAWSMQKQTDVSYQKSMELLDFTPRMYENTEPTRNFSVMEISRNLVVTLEVTEEDTTHRYEYDINSDDLRKLLYILTFQGIIVALV